MPSACQLLLRGQPAGRAPQRGVPSKPDSAPPALQVTRCPLLQCAGGGARTVCGCFGQQLPAGGACACSRRGARARARPWTLSRPAHAPALHCAPLTARQQRWCYCLGCRRRLPACWSKMLGPGPAPRSACVADPRREAAADSAGPTTTGNGLARIAQARSAPSSSQAAIGECGHPQQGLCRVQQRVRGWAWRLCGCIAPGTITAPTAACISHVRAPSPGTTGQCWTACSRVVCSGRPYQDDGGGLRSLQCTQTPFLAPMVMPSLNSSTSCPSRSSNVNLHTCRCTDESWPWYTCRSSGICCGSNLMSSPGHELAKQHAAVQPGQVVCMRVVGARRASRMSLQPLRMCRLAFKGLTCCAAC